MTHIVLIAGSHRQNSQSSKVAKYAATNITRINPSVTTDIVDLAGNPLPLWDGESGKPESNTGRAWQPIAARLQKADGFVVVSPEWSGMVPAGLKNLFLHASAKEMGHKPAMIISVSAGHGGTHPINELRISSYKNTRIVYTPDHVIVQNCGGVLNGDIENDRNDGYLRKRIDFSLRGLLAYTEAFKSIRAAGLENAEFPFGM